MSIFILMATAIVFGVWLIPSHRWAKPPARKGRGFFSCPQTVQPWAAVSWAARRCFLVCMPSPGLFRPQPQPLRRSATKPLWCPHGVPACECECECEPNVTTALRLPFRLDRRRVRGV